MANLSMSGPPRGVYTGRRGADKDQDQQRYDERESAQYERTGRGYRPVDANPGLEGPLDDYGGGRRSYGGPVDHRQPRDFRDDRSGYDYRRSEGSDRYGDGNGRPRHDARPRSPSPTYASKDARRLSALQTVTTPPNVATSILGKRSREASLEPGEEAESSPPSSAPPHSTKTDITVRGAAARPNSSTGPAIPTGPAADRLRPPVAKGNYEGRKAVTPHGISTSRYERDTRSRSPPRRQPASYTGRLRELSPPTGPRGSYDRPPPRDETYRGKDAYYDRRDSYYGRVQDDARGRGRPVSPPHADRELPSMSAREMAEQHERRRDEEARLRGLSQDKPAAASTAPPAPAAMKFPTPEVLALFARPISINLQGGAPKAQSPRTQALHSPATHPHPLAVVARDDQHEDVQMSPLTREHPPSASQIFEAAGTAEDPWAAWEAKIVTVPPRATAKDVSAQYQGRCGTLEDKTAQTATVTSVPMTKASSAASSTNSPWKPAAVQLTNRPSSPGHPPTQPSGAGQQRLHPAQQPGSLQRSRDSASPRPLSIARPSAPASTTGTQNLPSAMMPLAVFGGVHHSSAPSASNNSGPRSGSDATEQTISPTANTSKPPTQLGSGRGDLSKAPPTGPRADREKLSYKPPQRDTTWPEAPAKAAPRKTEEDMTAQERSRYRIAKLRQARLGDLQKACVDAFTALRYAKYGLANAEQDINIVNALRIHRLAHLNKYKESTY